MTDANLVLGYLDPTTFAAGTVPLYPERSAVALRTHVCEALGVDLAAAAHAIHEIANASMAAAVHVVTVQRGIDPRRFAMVALGGAGPMHAAAVAERFDIRTVIVPPGSGVGSAIGLLTTDLSVQRAHTFLAHESEVDLPALALLFDTLAAQAIADLTMGPTAVTVERSADLRYAGQAHEITVAAEDGPIDEEWWKQLVERFHRQYAQSFGDRARGPIEIVNARVRVIAPAEKLAPPVAPAGSSGRAPTARTVRDASFAAVGAYAPTPIFDRDDLHVGDAIDGPAIVEASESTVVVPPTWRATFDANGNLVLTRSAA